MIRAHRINALHDGHHDARPSGADTGHAGDAGESTAMESFWSLLHHRQRAQDTLDAPRASTPSPLRSSRPLRSRECAHGTRDPSTGRRGRDGRRRARPCRSIVKRTTAPSSEVTHSSTR